MQPFKFSASSSDLGHWGAPSSDECLFRLLLLLPLVDLLVGDLALLADDGLLLLGGLGRLLSVLLLLLLD